MLGQLISGGLRVLLITRGELPDWVTHVLELENMAVRWQGTSRNHLVRSRPWQPEAQARGTISGQENPSLALRAARVATALDDYVALPKGSPLIELRGVNVTYGEREVLKNVSWTVHAGERWAVLGPNGSGKTTLLALLCGDHPQAYANDLWLFGRKRGSGESIWEIKSHIGLVSPELHLYFAEPLTAFQTAATGFFDVLAHRPTSAAQDAEVRRLFEEFGLSSLGNRLFRQLSLGEQRLVLLVRALVKRPPLLVLDEPFQGLDEQAIERARGWLDQRLEADQTLLFVSHHAEEIPRTVHRRLRLEAGCVVEEM